MIHRKPPLETFKEEVEVPVELFMYLHGLFPNPYTLNSDLDEVYEKPVPTDYYIARMYRNHVLALHIKSPGLTPDDRNLLWDARTILAESVFEEQGSHEYHFKWMLHRIAHFTEGATVRADPDRPRFRAYLDLKRIEESTADKHLLIHGGERLTKKESLLHVKTTLHRFSHTLIEIKAIPWRRVNQALLTTLTDYDTNYEIDVDTFKKVFGHKAANLVYSSPVMFEHPDVSFQDRPGYIPFLVSPFAYLL